MATIFIGFTLQATALSIGALSAVQLIIILELPFTLILGSIVLGGSLRAQEWTAIATMTLGVALLLYMLEPQGCDPYSTGLTVWIIASALTVAVIAGLVLFGRRRDGAAKAALFGVATGMASGLIAVLTNAVLTVAAGGGIGGVVHWSRCSVSQSLRTAANRSGCSTWGRCPQSGNTDSRPWGSRFAAAWAWWAGRT